MGILCHPEWLYSDYYYYALPKSLVDYFFEQQPFDAYELIGGYKPGKTWTEAASNNLQLARYIDTRARGQKLPIVGVSDAHGCETGKLFGWYYTIAFSPTSELPDLIDSIKDEWSVAVEALPGGSVRAYGPLRLVRYSHFLLREVFPQHDQLCVREGQLMLDYLAGKAGAEEGLRLRQGEVEKFYQKYWEQ